MVDDKRRAEIEAVARALAGDRILEDPSPVDREMALQDARRAIAALDRVRDARGEDREAGIWRVGRKVGRTIYAQTGSEPTDDDELIGVMDTPALAAVVVDAVNALSRVSPSRDDTVAAEDDLVRRIVARIRRGAPCDSDARHLIFEAIAEAVEREFSPSTSDQEVE